MYVRMFRAIVDLRPNVQPETFMMDFEKASINAFATVFPNSGITSCLFHFSQNIYRKVVELGFKERYNQDVEFNLRIKCLSSLAFLPIDHVIDGFEELSHEDNIPEEVLNYFEKYYIGEITGRRSKNQRKLQLFPLETWNIHNRTLRNMPRTNNNLEAYHRAIQSSITCMHASKYMEIN